MKILTQWLRTFLPALPPQITDRQLADDLTLRGIAVEGVHSVAGGHLFEMDITTNRVDAMNHYGIAREAATIYNLPLAPLRTDLPPASSSPTFPVRIAAPGLCGRFTARILRDVTIGPSSGRIPEYFNLLGQKLILNAVDASNFVLLGMGQPTHAFDLDKIEGGIIVRLAHPGETLKLLDGSLRNLAPDDLVIADERKPISLAGVMGGWDSMITPNTRNILVESAWFSPAAVRRSARRHGLHTDASHRFERGADFSAAPIANHLVTQLILHSGGQIAGDLIDILVPEVESQTARRAPIALSVEEVTRHLGATLDPHGITPTIVEQYLESLGCTLTPSPSHAGTSFQVQLPAWRLDLEREIDLIEEIARVYGYNRFSNTLPTPLPVIADPLAASQIAVRTRLLALGFSEAISSTFASEADAAVFASPTNSSTAVALENPLSDEARLLRPTLVPGMLTMLSGNLNRDVRTVRLFERGEIFTGTSGEVHERTSLALGLTDTASATPLHSAADAPFFELKGAIESLVSLFTAGPENTSPAQPGQSAASALTFATDPLPAWLQPGRAAIAALSGRPVAAFGELLRDETARRKLRQPVYLAEIDLAALYALPLRRPSARELSRFQAVARDFSFTFPDTLPWAEIRQSLLDLAIPELQTVQPKEIFRDPKGRSVPPGHHALLIHAIFQSGDHTLSEAELTPWWSRIIATLTALGGTIRAPEEATRR